MNLPKNLMSNDPSGGPKDQVIQTQPRMSKLTDCSRIPYEYDD